MKTVWASTGILHQRLEFWASQRIFGHARGFGPSTLMGIVDGDTLIGVAVFHNFDRKAGVIEMSGVSADARWLNRPVLLEMFSYPFDQLGCQMVVMRVSAKDKRLARMLTAYGYTGTMIPRLRGRNEDEIIYCLTEEAWRANGFHGKPLRISPDNLKSEAA